MANVTVTLVLRSSAAVAVNTRTLCVLVLLRTLQVQIVIYFFIYFNIRIVVWLEQRQLINHVITEERLPRRLVVMESARLACWSVAGKLTMGARYVWLAADATAWRTWRMSGTAVSLRPRWIVHSSTADGFRTTTGVESLFLYESWAQLTGREERATSSRTLVRVRIHRTQNINSSSSVGEQASSTYHHQRSCLHCPNGHKIDVLQNR